METKMTERADYITEALELIGIDLSAPKRIVQEVSGFTPIFDCVISQYHDETKAAVHGAMWRFCQMEDGVCKASLETIGEMIGVSPATVMRHAEELVKDGYFNDLTPDLRNKPHVYADAGKVVMKSKLAAGISQRNVGISERKASISQRNVGISERKASISQSQLNKDINKESNKTASPLSPEELAKANKLVDAIIANSSGSHFEGREIFLPDHLPLVDWYHKRTGQVCRKKDRNSWMKAVREWVDAGLTPDDLQAAYEVDIVWRKVIANPNELTSKAIALKAQKKAQPKEQEFYRTL